jgi:hypothetical protein
MAVPRSEAGPVPMPVAAVTVRCKRSNGTKSSAARNESMRGPREAAFCLDERSDTGPGAQAGALPIGPQQRCQATTSPCSGVHRWLNF